MLDVGYGPDAVLLVDVGRGPEDGDEVLFALLRRVVKREDLGDYAVFLYEFGVALRDGYALGLLALEAGGRVHGV